MGAGGACSELVDHFELVSMRARLYDPSTGRFVQRDTLVQGGGGSQGLNRYAYVQHNPVNATDPSGRCLGPAVVVCVGGMVADWILVGGAAATGTSMYMMQNEVGQDLVNALSPDDSEVPGIPRRPLPEEWRASTQQPEPLPSEVQRGVQPPSGGDPWWIWVAYYGYKAAEFFKGGYDKINDITGPFR